MNLLPKRSPRFQSLAEWWYRTGHLPAPRLLLLCSITIPMIVFGFMLSTAIGTAVVLLLLTALIGFSLWEITLFPSVEKLQLQRKAKAEWDVRRPAEIQITLNIVDTAENWNGQLRDDVPHSFQVSQDELSWSGSGDIQLRYTVEPQMRGSYQMRFIWVRIRGIFGLWDRQIRVPCYTQIDVIPDMSVVRGMLQTLQQQLVLEGRRIRRRRESGSEFQLVRDYAVDDDPRHVNWQATARAGKMMSNVYEPERGKLLTLMIDTGRLTAVELENETKLDRTLEAALILAAVALQNGDRVAVMAFSYRVHVYVTPERGMRHLRTILRAVFDLQSDGAESNYPLALDAFMQRQRKRSLLILFSDLDQHLFEERLVPFLYRMRRTHFILLASMRNQLMEGHARKTPVDISEAYIRSTAQSWAMERRLTAKSLDAAGVRVLDVAPQSLPLAAVNAYLSLKSRDAW